MSFPQYQPVYKKFCQNLSSFGEHDRLLLQKVFLIAKQQHRGQKKFGLWAYIIHPLAIFNFLTRKLKRNDINILITAFLHDTVEDGDITLLEIKKIFGQEVYSIMKLLTRFRQPNETEEEKIINKRKHFLKVAKGSHAARLIKIADEYDNMKNWLNIPKRNHNRKKFPRWLKEAEEHLALARKTNKTAYSIFKKEFLKVQTALEKEQ